MTTTHDDERSRTVEDALAVLRREGVDTIRWSVEARVDKFTAAQEAEAILIAEAEGRPVGEILLERFTPYATVDAPGNLLTRQGRKRLIDRLVDTASNQALDASHLRIGVGNGNTSAADTDTDLAASAGSGNRQFKLADGAAAVGTGSNSGVMTVVATFGTGVANFAWEEWAIDGGTGDGTTVTSEGNTTPGIINRKVTSLGTKSAAAAWVFTVTITLA